MEEFEAYLISKKIDTRRFEAEEPELWGNWSKLFSNVHPNSFTQQKLFLINNIRRRFPLTENMETAPEVTILKPKPKPKFKVPVKPKNDGD